MVTGRKRSADPTSWKRNKVKKLRNSVCFYILQIYILYKNRIFMTIREKSILIIAEIRLKKIYLKLSINVVERNATIKYEMIFKKPIR
jgi:hypothetical protein